MMAGRVNKVADVFGVSRDLPLNYVERAAVDSLFLSNLALEKHVIVYGSSKQGKTCLRKHCLSEDDTVLVQCQNSWGLEKLAEAILKEVGYKVTVSEEKTIEKRNKLRVSLSSSLSALGFGEAKAEAEASHESGSANKKLFQPLEIDPADPNDLVSALNKINFHKFIVLEDFHYLPFETQEQYAGFLKAIHEKSKISFIIVAVWREENRLILLNGDLTGRVVSVDADEWTSEELGKAISNGEDLLNVKVPDVFKDELISRSLGSIFIVQECCRRLCGDNGLVETSDRCFALQMKQSVEEYIRNVVAESGPRYTAFLTAFASGFQSTTLEMYRWLLYPVLTSSVEDLEKGLKYKHIREILDDVHPNGVARSGNSLNPGNVTQALLSVSALQASKKIKPFILDYDRVNKVLSVVERGFLIWLADQNIPDLLSELQIMPPTRLEA